MSQLDEARNWLADCFPWDEIGDLNPGEVWDGVERHYDGGLVQFATDSDTASPFVYIPHHGPCGNCGPCTGYASRIRSLSTVTVTRAYGPIPSTLAEGGFDY